MTSYIIPKDFEYLLKILINSKYVNTIALDIELSEDLFNYLKDNKLLYYFNNIYLSKYVPLEMVNNTIFQINWDTVAERKDLTDKFIMKNMSYINIWKLNNNIKISFEIMYNNLKDKTKIYDAQIIIHKLLNLKNYSYEKFYILFELLMNTNTINNYSYSLTQLSNYSINNTINNFYKLFMENYYIDNNPSNLFNLIKFLKIFCKIIHINILNYEDLSNNLLNKLTDYEYNYLIENNLMNYPKYYDINLDTNIINKIFKILYIHRYKLINKNINPFIIKGYNVYELEELIKCSFESGCNFKNIWNYISDNILDLSYPDWFWKKYKLNIYWQYATENIIKKLNEDDYSMMNLFVKWMYDNYDSIQQYFFPNIPECLILPEIMIASFYSSPLFNLENVLGFQKISLKILNYIIKKDNSLNISNRILTSKHWDKISYFQILDPTFIKKYEKNLNWQFLKYNPTLNLYTKELFHKLPIKDNTNKYLWMTIDEKILELHRYNIQCTKQDEYINLNICQYDILNHKFRNYDHLYNSSNPKLSFSKNKYLFNNENWKLRKSKFKHSIIPNNKYDKVVFTFNTNIMDGDITKWSNTFNKTPNNYIPLIKCHISTNSNYLNNQINVNIHYKNIIIVEKKNSDPSIILLYLPLYENIIFTS